MERKCVIIGSFRKNMDEVKAVAEIFKNKNIEVLSPVSFNIVDPKEEFVILESNKSEQSIKDIEDEVLQKMLTTDFVYLVNPNGRVGLSAAFEIGYANAANITVYSMEMADDLMIRRYIKGVVSPEEI